jgi:acyl-[acyl carrier protein]--UDP-N-acetylglucosamine O-acyltransferase
VDGVATFKDSLTTAQGVEYGLTGGHKHGFLRATKTLIATANTNTILTLGVLPANCRIVNLIFSTDATITTVGLIGADLQFSLGVSTTFGQIINSKAIADVGGVAVSIESNVQYYLIKDGRPAAMNGLAATGIKEDGSAPSDPITNEAITLSANLSIAATDRTIVVLLKPILAALTAVGNVTVILEFMTV